MWLLGGLVIASILSSAEAAGQRDWAWFTAISSINAWTIHYGKAEVVLDGGRFRAELYDEDDLLRIKIEGTIVRGQINAAAVIQSTGDQPRKLSGRYEARRWREWNEGRPRESILLTESGMPSGLTIGLTRERTSK